MIHIFRSIFSYLITEGCYGRTEKRGSFENIDYDIVCRCDTRFYYIIIDLMEENVMDEHPMHEHPMDKHPLDEHPMDEYDTING